MLHVLREDGREAIVRLAGHDDAVGIVSAGDDSQPRKSADCAKVEVVGKIAPQAGDRASLVDVRGLGRVALLARAARDGARAQARRAPELPLPLLRAHAPSDDALRRARHDERRYARAVRRLHHYNLIDQNCATAIFETINASLGDSRALAEARLGGYVPSRGSLAFIPFVSARAVEARYRVVARQTIPSYRERRLAEMRREESRLRVALRESNPFTSKTYVRNPADSFFVFFTDDAPLLRPVLGAVNLTAALGQTTLGLVRAPFDRGAWLVDGLRGTFVSLVELAFANIRKGSNEWIPEAHRSVEPIPEPASAPR